MSKHTKILLTAPILFFIVLAGIAYAGAKLPKADHLPSPLTAQQKTLISEGISLNDAGRYSDAILKYKQVLNESPDAIEAIYELGYLYFLIKDYENALPLARRGLQYKSEVLPNLYVLLGNTLDEMGKRDEAIEIYKEALKRSPKTALLHFNFGLALMRAGKLPEAKESVQKSLYLSPNHASSHYVLANLYYRLEYRIPAILSLSRFLLLEPDSKRAREAIPMLDRMIAGGVRKGDKPNTINITLALTPESKKDEGDFGAVETAMSLNVAAAQMGDKKEVTTPFKSLASTYSMMGSVMSSAKGKGFAAKYYGPFFAQLAKGEHTEAFVSQAFQTAKLQGAAEWIAENDSRIQEFQTWLSAYRFPESK
jgi:tetratricopeptide (TPR) repeat protein